MTASTRMAAAPAPDVKCARCPSVVNALTLFPGGICIDCYRPEGERLAQAMTAGRLRAMWSR